VSAQFIRHFTNMSIKDLLKIPRLCEPVADAVVATLLRIV
jgi:hypothetical protein